MKNCIDIIFSIEKPNLFRDDLLFFLQRIAYFPVGDDGGVETIVCIEENVLQATFSSDTSKILLSDDFIFYRFGVDVGILE